MRLTDVTYANGRMAYRSRHATEPESALPGYLAEADRVLASALAAYPAEELTDETTPFEALRWFVLPSEALRELTGRGSESAPPRTLAATG